ncbi:MULTISPECIES: hypothetical protein [Halorussus]|uniref:hypothetical protein n=1 Tax=Halorussus TaxID=1070314 RepID=UPI0013B46234|nr:MULTISPECIES: hypothetical protein [Halorussus]NHN61687.1 hypothetical protein [Halorussus sp. JP-T4]
MTRKQLLVGLLAVAVLSVVIVTTVAGGSNAAAEPPLAEQIHDQTNATRAALTAAENPWAPRVGGLGIGLAVGLLGGGLVAYVNRGDGG